MNKSRLFSIFVALMAFSGYSVEAECLDLRSTWDYVIVGNGTAGATLASELAKDGNNSVLVLEWGENRADDPKVLSPDYFAFTNDLAYDPLYAITQPVNVSFSPFVPQYFIYSDGRMWGGSSAHNGLFAVRGTPTLYNNWATLSGESQWNYANLLPLFLETELYTPNGTVSNPTQRGSDGPLFITQSAPVDTDAFAIAVGTGTSAPQVDDYNDPDEGDIGISAHQQYISPAPGSFRSFSVNAFTPIGQVLNAQGFGLGTYKQLRVVSNALVNRVLFKNKEAAGVEYYLGGDPNKAIYVKAKKKVILCAGSPWSPGILERSGIGDATLLSSLGIEVIVDNPNVGEHLQNHYGVTGFFTGTTTVFPFLQGFIDLQPYEPGDGTRRMQLAGIDTGAGIALSGILMQPKSEGSVHIVSRNPTIYPRMDFNMYTDGDVSTPGTDAYDVVSYLKLLQDIDTAFAGGSLASPPASVYAGGDSALLEFAQTQSNMAIAFHAAGTCRMGTSQSDSVVNGDLHVFGVRNLMVADVSIEPIIQDGNTAYAAYFIGQVAANIIKGN